MMATNPDTTAQQGLFLGGGFGQEGENTGPSPRATLAETTLLHDGFSSIIPTDMYRIEELAPERREPQFPGIHNLHPDVVHRTISAPAIQGVLPQRRARLWDVAARAVEQALVGIPAGSHVSICANRQVFLPSSLCHCFERNY